MEKFSNEVAEKLKVWIDSADVRSIIEATKAADDSETGIFEMVITTEDVDRYREVILLEGWELDHYNNNPVVLWGHDHYTLPVGITTSLEKRDGKLIARGKFAPHAHAQEIRQLYDAQVIRASSVGFIEKEREGNIITKAELIEWSFVSVPANPHALALAMKAGLSINELVTKGFLNVKAAEPEETPDEEVAEEEVTNTPEPEVEERQFGSKALTPVIEQLRAALGALEALNTEEPERTEEEPEGDEEDEEARALREFEDRRIIQKAATLISDILAEKRRERLAQLKN